VTVGPRRVAAVYALGVVPSILDGVAVNLALVPISRDFGVPVSASDWVVTGYLLAVAAVIPVTGWAADRFGARRVWMAAIGLFAAGSLLSALAWSLPVLVLTRVLQGLGGGMLVPVGQALVIRGAPAGQRGRAIGLAQAPLLVAPIFGPLVGGLFVAYLSWRWIFLVNIPLALLALTISRRILPADGPTERHRLDVGGLALLTGGLTLIVLGLSQAGDGGVPVAAVTAVAAGVVLAAVFWRHAARLGPRAVLAVGLLRRRSFGLAAVVAFLFNASLWGGLATFALLLEFRHGLDPPAIGLVLAPQGFGSLAAMLVGGRLADRRGPRGIALAGASLAAATTLVCALATGLSDVAFAGLMLGRGLGLSSMMIAAYSAAYADVGATSAAQATTTLNVVSRVGAATGVATLLTLVAVFGGTRDDGAFTAALLVATAAPLLAGATALRWPAHR
jgi:EmrB/QacA subfamily drug resistance transporter